MAKTMTKSTLLFIILLGCIGWGTFYVYSHLEFQDPHAPSEIFEGALMTPAERQANPLKAVALRPQFAKQQYEQLGTLITLLDQAGIPYWITCGTLLGAVRHEGLIPHDDDADLNIEAADAERLLKLKAHLAKHGLGIYQDRTSIKVYSLNGLHVRPKKKTFKISPGIWFVRRKQERFPTIDIYPVTRQNGKVIHANHRALKAFKGEVYQEQDIYPLKTYQFGPLHVKGPQNPHFFLTYNYGSDWDKYYYFSGTHTPGKHAVIKQPLTPELKQRFYRYAAQ
jgi:LPS biosynthesis protein